MSDYYILGAKKESFHLSLVSTGVHAISSAELCPFTTQGTCDCVLKSQSCPDYHSRFVRTMLALFVCCC